MRILLASSEVHPFSKTGGLADMVGALAKTLARLGHDVAVVTPLYAGIQKRFPQLSPGRSFSAPLGPGTIEGRFWTLSPEDRLTLYFLEQPDFYNRPTLYHKGGVDYPDNAARFIFLSKAAAQAAFDLGSDVVHVNDWQTGLVPLLVGEEVRKRQGRAPRTCITIHNLAYQGVFPATFFPLTNLPWSLFTPNTVEFYGQMGLLKAGIASADSVTAVSPRYAREITTAEYGCGLDGLLRFRQSRVFGILNGVDYDEWKTTGNPFLKHDYSAADLSGKALNKADLQSELHLPSKPDVPLFGSVGRLVDQKGVDIMLASLEEMLPTGLQFALLGSGTPAYEKAFRDLASRFPSQVAVRIGFDEGLSHRIESGCDFFLMPSRFEPCGLNQMYSLRYGSVPVVRRTGGLDDTVIDVAENALKADGIKFGDCSAPALSKAIRKALVLYNEAALLHRFRTNGMNVDFSWGRTAAEYVKVYGNALG